MKPAEDPALYQWQPVLPFSLARTMPGDLAFGEAVTAVAPLPFDAPPPSIQLDALRADR